MAGVDGARDVPYRDRAGNPQQDAFGLDAATILLDQLALPDYQVRNGQPHPTGNTAPLQNLDNSLGESNINHRLDVQIAANAGARTSPF